MLYGNYTEMFDWLAQVMIEDEISYIIIIVQSLFKMTLYIKQCANIITILDTAIVCSPYLKNHRVRILIRADKDCKILQEHQTSVTFHLLINGTTIALF